MKKRQTKVRKKHTEKKYKRKKEKTRHRRNTIKRRIRKTMKKGGANTMGFESMDRHTQDLLEEVKIKTSLNKDTHKGIAQRYDFHTLWKHEKNTTLAAEYLKAVLWGFDFQKDNKSFENYEKALKLGFSYDNTPYTPYVDVIKSINNDITYEKYKLLIEKNFDIEEYLEANEINGFDISKHDFYAFNELEKIRNKNEQLNFVDYDKIKENFDSIEKYLEATEITGFDISKHNFDAFEDLKIIRSLEKHETLDFAYYDEKKKIYETNPENTNVQEKIPNTITGFNSTRDTFERFLDLLSLNTELIKQNLGEIDFDLYHNYFDNKDFNTYTFIKAMKIKGFKKKHSLHDYETLEYYNIQVIDKNKNREKQIRPLNFNDYDALKTWDFDNYIETMDINGFDPSKHDIKTCLLLKNINSLLVADGKGIQFDFSHYDECSDEKYNFFKNLPTIGSVDSVTHLYYERMIDYHNAKSAEITPEMVNIYHLNTGSDCVYDDYDKAKKMGFDVQSTEENRARDEMSVYYESSSLGWVKNIDTESEYCTKIHFINSKSLRFTTETRHSAYKNDTEELTRDDKVFDDYKDYMEHFIHNKHFAELEEHQKNAETYYRILQGENIQIHQGDDKYPYVEDTIIEHYTVQNLIDDLSTPLPKGDKKKDVKYSSYHIHETTQLIENPSNVLETLKRYYDTYNSHYYIPDNIEKHLSGILKDFTIKNPEKKDELDNNPNLKIGFENAIKIVSSRMAKYIKNMNESNSNDFVTNLTKHIFYVLFFIDHFLDNTVKYNWTYEWLSSILSAYLKTKEEEVEKAKVANKRWNEANWNVYVRTSKLDYFELTDQTRGNISCTKGMVERVVFSLRDELFKNTRSREADRQKEAFKQLSAEEQNKHRKKEQEEQDLKYGPVTRKSKIQQWVQQYYQDQDQDQDQENPSFTVKKLNEYLKDKINKYEEEKINANEEIVYTKKDWEQSINECLDETIHGTTFIKSLDIKNNTKEPITDLTNSWKNAITRIHVESES